MEFLDYHGGRVVYSVFNDKDIWPNDSFCAPSGAGMSFKSMNILHDIMICKTGSINKKLEGIRLSRLTTEIRKVTK